MLTTISHTREWTVAFCITLPCGYKNQLISTDSTKVSKQLQREDGYYWSTRDLHSCYQQSTDCWYTYLASHWRQAYCQTWQLPRETTQRRSNQCSSKKSNQHADGVTRGVTKMADKMAVPTPTRKEEQLNVEVCSTPFYTHGLLSEVSGTCTPSPADTTTDHSPEGEWKEVI